ncbi:MAG: Bro-N domain-containing protein [Oscillospiraceae bacterium]|nr:Bro-N domain-containing protein [Oscillospiraceae bacterium]
MADKLGYERPTKAVQDHVDLDDKDEIPIRDSIGRMQSTPIINESGLYSLMLSSKMPAAKIRGCRDLQRPPEEKKVLPFCLFEKFLKSPFLVSLIHVTQKGLFLFFGTDGTNPASRAALYSPTGTRFRQVI